MRFAGPLEASDQHARMSPSRRIGATDGELVLVTGEVTSDLATAVQQAFTLEEPNDQLS